MPITFESPEPFDASIASRYGASQSLNSILPTMASMANANAQHGIEQQRIAANFAESGADRQARQNQFGASLNWDEAKHTSNTALAYDEMKQRASLFQAQQANQFALADQHVKNQAWLSQQEFNQADAMEMRQIDHGVSQLKADLKANKITQPMFDAMLPAMSMTKNQLRAKQQMTEQKHVEMQTQMMAMKVQQETKLQDDADSFRAAAADGKYTYQGDPDAIAEFSQHIRDAHPMTDPKLVRSQAEQMAIDAGRASRSVIGKDGRAIEDPGWNAMRMARMKEHALAGKASSGSGEGGSGGKSHDPEGHDKAMEQATKIVTAAAGPGMPIDEDKVLALADKIVLRNIKLREDQKIRENQGHTQMVQEASTNMQGMQITAQRVIARPDVPPEIKKAATIASEAVTRLTEKYTSQGKPMPAVVKRVYDQHEAFLRSLIPLSQPQQLEVAPGSPQPEAVATPAEPPKTGLGRFVKAELTDPARRNIKPGEFLQAKKDALLKEIEDIYNPKDFNAGLDEIRRMFGK